jgi:hypothetical protein
VNTGKLIEAVNLGQANDTGGVSNGAGTPAVTMNGVTFAASAGQGGDIAAVDGRSFYRDFYHDPAAQPIVGLSDSDANALLDSYEFAAGVGNTLARFEGLIEGQEYLVQLFNSTGGRNDDPLSYGYNEYPAINPAAISTSDGTYTLENYPGTPTAIITATFTSDASGIQDIHIEAQNSGLNMEFNAFQLRTVAGTDSLALSGFSYDSSTGGAGVTIAGKPNTAYSLAEADDLDFSNPEQSAIPLGGATASVGSIVGDTIVTDESGNAVVENVSLGTPNKAATFIRAEEAP